VRVACIHGLFSSDALKRLEAQPDVLEITCTNTVPIRPDKRVPKRTVLSVAPALAEAMRRIHNGESVSDLFQPDWPTPALPDRADHPLDAVARVGQADDRGGEALGLGRQLAQHRHHVGQQALDHAHREGAVDLSASHVSFELCGRRSRKPTSTAARSRATRQSGGCAVWGRPCGSQRSLPVGPPSPGPARLQQARLARPRGGLTGHRAHPEKGVSSFDAAYADCRNASAVTVALF
jgi:hypothetical protein